MAVASVSFGPELAYRDPMAALDWLAKAFGFETRILVTGATGEFVFAESGCGGATAGIVPERPPKMLSPLGTGGASSGAVHVRFEADGADIDAHCARARAAGAVILQEPRQEFYGDQTYACADPEGHVWNFGVRMADVRPSPPPEGWTVSFPSGRPL
jgi:uncharacterized glyoxalase superfamily protein PhnB